MDFPDLRKRDLKQKPRRMWNFIERSKIWGAMIFLSYEGSTELLDKIDGVEFVEFLEERIDCSEYIFKRPVNELCSGVLRHDGNVRPGDFILYGYNINEPTHVGLVQNDGRILSKWGATGPVMLHQWNKIIPDYGRYAFYSRM